MMMMLTPLLTCGVFVVGHQGLRLQLARCDELAFGSIYSNPLSDPRSASVSNAAVTPSSPRGQGDKTPIQPPPPADQHPPRGHQEDLDGSQQQLPLVSPPSLNPHSPVGSLGTEMSTPQIISPKNRANSFIKSVSKLVSKPSSIKASGDSEGPPLSHGNSQMNLEDIGEEEGWETPTSSPYKGFNSQHGRGKGASPVRPCGCFGGLLLRVRLADSCASPPPPPGGVMVVGVGCGGAVDVMSVRFSPVVKQGYLWKRSSNVRKDWKRRFFSIRVSPRLPLDGEAKKIRHAYPVLQPLFPVV